MCVGRFTEKKGFDDLLRALAVVKEKTDLPWSCDIVGGGELEPYLLSMHKDLNLADKVKFLGYIKPEEDFEKVQSAHLYLQPSKTASDGDME